VIRLVTIVTGGLGQMSTLPALRSLYMHELASFSVPGLMKIRIEGREALPHEGPILLLANRCSLMDPWLLSLAAGRAVQVGATSPLFWLPGLGDLATRLGTVPLLPNNSDEIGATETAGRFARALERDQPVALFGDFGLGLRAVNSSPSSPTRFLEILLATRSARIPVVPVLAAGHGWQLKLHNNPLLSPLLRAGARLVNTPYPPVVFTENLVRLGRPVFWREGGPETTLEDFRKAVEHSLAELY
jgi:1-acyl-sn-glycerol-3-phosphate acyltransferase